MAFSWQQIKYGWVALTSIALTGTTIYIASNIRRHIQQIDIIEFALGTTERCLATQHATNPLYRVNPPSFVRSWKNTNGVDENVTNAIGYYIDKSMIVSLDTTIKQLVPYYGMSNSPGENWTVTGLWAHLGIGDKTSEFTSVPCWTNFQDGVAVSTNIATYGNYSQHIYVEALQERYKVLNALEYFIDENKTIISNGVSHRVAFWNAVYQDFYSNKTTGVIVSGYRPAVARGSFDALQIQNVLGLDFYYYDTNYYMMGPESFYQDAAYYDGDLMKEYWDSLPPSPGTSIALSFFCSAKKYPYSTWLEPNYEYRVEIDKSGAIFKWANYHNTNIPSTFKVYAMGATAIVGSDNSTESKTNEWWYYPAEWHRVFYCPYEEDFSETNLYTQISSEYIIEDGIYNIINFGWDEFDLPGTIPPPTFAAEPSGGVSVSNNTGSYGTSWGMTIPLANIKGVRKFQFSYCTNKFW